MRDKVLYRGVTLDVKEVKQGKYFNCKFKQQSIPIVKMKP